ncbi:hypothetical protein DE146DRAFT_645574 [Phaeosphaeria sp. MPI-PUGE-AT-0046c]|nr:hypothetical protein DE146DRAFT_645574 [Phaeosphaeria sp. MPI-PUGE-AT-0046c]
MHLPQVSTTVIVPAMAVLLATAPGAQAMPAIPAMLSSMVKSIKPAVEARGFNGMGPVSLYLAIKDYLKDANAYDPSVPNKCNIFMATTAGGNCETSINCRMSDNAYEKLPGWNVCYLGGRQYFNHPDIGDFSITFSKAGGKDGNHEDGLHDPILQFANLNDWEPMDVQKIMDDSKGKHGNLCKKTNVAGTQRITYECGIPKIGTAAFGLSIFKPVDPAPGFAPGWCTMHVIQHQRNEYGVGSEYEFDVIIYDHDKKVIGKVQRAAINAGSKTLSVTSKLPYTVEVEAKGGDTDPVKFSYGGQVWQNNDKSHQSTFSNGKEHGYEYGNREGDMGFTC